MMEFKNTPAPWPIQPHTQVDKSFMVGPIEIDYDDVNHEEQDANALLVSGCVEMRDALIKILGEPHKDKSKYLDDVQEIIALLERVIGKPIEEIMA